MLALPGSAKHISVLFYSIIFKMYHFYGVFLTLYTIQYYTRWSITTGPYIFLFTVHCTLWYSMIFHNWSIFTVHYTSCRNIPPLIHIFFSILPMANTECLVYWEIHLALSNIERVGFQYTTFDNDIINYIQWNWFSIAKELR